MRHYILGIKELCSISEEKETVAIFSTNTLYIPNITNVNHQGFLIHRPDEQRKAAWKQTQVKVTSAVAVCRFTVVWCLKKWNMTLILGSCKTNHCTLESTVKNVAFLSWISSQILDTQRRRTIFTVRYLWTDKYLSDTYLYRICNIVHTPQLRVTQNGLNISLIDDCRQKHTRQIAGK